MSSVKCETCGTECNDSFRGCYHHPPEARSAWIVCGGCKDSWQLQCENGQSIKAKGHCIRCQISREAKRYRWLRDNKHLGMWWSVQGPEDRNENIDADIDDAMLNGV